MESVEIEFTALPAHVRTARLVASAVARQCGVDEAVLDEVRLAVGEACSRAVELHAREAPDRPVPKQWRRPRQPRPQAETLDCQTNRGSRKWQVPKQWRRPRQPRPQAGTVDCQTNRGSRS
jgi:Histidine kinase-like ATPase domain